MADAWDQFPDAPSDAYARNKAYAKPAASYQTKLDPAQESQFQSWVKQNNVPFQDSPTADYDMRGFYKGLQAHDPHAQTGINQNDGKLHFGDYYKTPYHKSFSRESQWATDGAPSWNDKDQLISPAGQVVFDERAPKGDDPWSQFPDVQQAQPAAPQQRTDPRGAFGEALMSLGSNYASMIPAGLAGVGTMAGNALGLTDRQPGDVVENVSNAMTYQPRTAGGQRMTDIIAKPGQWIQRGGDITGDQANAQGSQQQRISATAANYGVEPMQARDNRSPGERAMEGAVANTAVQTIPSLLLKGRSGGVVRDVNRAPDLGGNLARVPGEPARAPVAAPKRQGGLEGVPEPAPTKEALKAQSSAAYKRADESGAVITPESFSGVKQSIGGMLDKEGIDPTLHPATTAALKRINETQGPVTLQKLETLRKIVRDAEDSPSPADTRLAAKTLETLDNFAETLSARDMSAGSAESVGALKEARSLWSRARKAEELDELMHRAELKAPNFSASGMENAIRTEFRAFALNKNRMRYFTTAERKAIERVAKGDLPENALRYLGKLAPTGSISGYVASALGAAVAGPGGAVALPAAGAAARYGAAKLTTRNAMRANELVRRGPLPKSRNALRERETEPR